MSNAENTPVVAPHFHASAFQAIASETEVSIVAGYLQPTFAASGGFGEATNQAALVLHLSPQSAMDLAKVLENTMANYNASFTPVSTAFSRGETQGG